MGDEPVLTEPPAFTLPARRWRSLKRAVCCSVAIAWVLVMVMPDLVFGSYRRRLLASVLVACFLAAAVKALDAGKAS